MAQTRSPVDYIERTREQYSSLGYPVYRWVESETPPPFAPIEKALAKSRLGLVASGGVYLKGQVAFHWKDDLSYRDVDVRTPTSDLRATHFAYDLEAARSDPNVVFPLDTLHGLVADGVLGGLGRNAYAFMGGIYSSRSVGEKLAPAITQRLVEDEVDLALLVPV